MAICKDYLKCPVKHKMNNCHSELMLRDGKKIVQKIKCKILRAHCKLHVIKYHKAGKKHSSESVVKSLRMFNGFAGLAIHENSKWPMKKGR